MAFLVIPSTLTTPLQAVNLMLSAIRRAPVADLEDDTVGADPEVARAVNVLDQTDLDVQSEGWWFNREWAYPVLPDAITGYLLVPDQTLEMTRAYLPDVGADLNVVLRGATIYDRDRRTLDFSDYPGGVQVDITVRLEWDQLPQAARRVIALRAVQTFTSTADASTTTIQINAADLRMARAILDNQQDRAMGSTGRNNSLQGISPLLALHGNRGLSRNRRGY